MTVTFRCLPVIQSQIQEAAARIGRSASEEIERRIEDSFKNLPGTDIRTKMFFDNIVQIISILESASGKKWWEDEITSGMCGRILKALLEELMPEPQPPAKELLSLVESDADQKIREARDALLQLNIQMNMMDRAIAILNGDAGRVDAGRPVDNSPKSGKKFSKK